MFVKCQNNSVLINGVHKDAQRMTNTFDLSQIVLAQSKIAVKCQNFCEILKN